MPIQTQSIPTAQEWADKMIRNANAAGEDWVNGVKRPRRSFKQAAIAAKEKHKTNTMAALQQDKFAKGMQAVDEDAAINTAVAVGAAGYTSGINARVDKIRKKIEKLQPLVASHVATIQSLPQDTEQQREARMIQNLRGMRDVGKKMSGV